MTVAYYTTPISDNIEETPEGNLVCRDAVIGRTGWQQYQVKDLPPKAAEKLGVDMSNPSANIDLYRKADDVFHPDTLASFEGKAVTDSHPPEFVTPENFPQHAKGHIQNVREGKEPLESGDYPILADIHITAEPLLSKVRNKLVRELSCGYDYSIEREGERINQVSIVGNHVAVVPKGRAGEEARINDAAPAEPSAAQPQPTTRTKEVPKVSNIFKHLLGLGLKSYATDADPEKLAEAAEAVRSAGETARATDRRSRDSEVPPELEHAGAEDKQARDKRMHDALQRMLDGVTAPPPAVAKTAGSEAAVDTHADDADLAELSGLLGEYFGEEQGEEEHAADDVDLECTNAEGEEEVEEDPVGTTDRASASDAHGGAIAVLKGLRPFVARSNDASMKKAFNTALASVSKTSTASTGGYGRFAATSRARDGAGRNPNPARGRANDATVVDRNAKLQAAYNEALKGGK